MDDGSSASFFLTALDARCLDDGSWVVQAPLRYRSALLNCIVEVPAGFRTDFASVPRVPIVYMAWGDRAHHEAVIHDYLYRIDSAPFVARSVADRVFLEAMCARGKSCGVRWPMYLGVRLGGWTAYHRKRVAE
jgi:hypothetical protein